MHGHNVVSLASVNAKDISLTALTCYLWMLTNSWRTDGTDVCSLTAKWKLKMALEAALVLLNTKAVSSPHEAYLDELMGPVEYHH